MVARITIPGRLLDALNYNEKKVQRGVAELIGDANFLLPSSKMNFYHKLEGFEQRNSLNGRAATKTLHVSLNFDPSENLTDETLKNIADDYMLRIGFNDQPYLIYRHKDAGHPHIHILSTTIRADGTRINTHNIGRNQSEPARKAIEAKYKLVQASANKSLQQQPLAINAEKIQYGKSETRRSIANVLLQVIPSWNYASLPELNAILKQYNVVADRGKEDGFIYSKKGLQYKVLDKDGNPVGVPIKASSLPDKPTLNNLQQKLDKNKLSKEKLKPLVKYKVDEALLTKPHTLQELIAQLSKRNIKTVLRQNAEGRIYGITFVDTQCKAVFNGSDVGKEYSINGLLKQMNTSTPVPLNKNNNIQPVPSIKQQHDLSVAILDDLLMPIADNSLTPYLLKKKKRKKKNHS